MKLTSIALSIFALTASMSVLAEDLIIHADAALDVKTGKLIKPVTLVVDDNKIC